ncbi:FecR domain-containing protein [Sulfurimonas sp. SAG-AH-194-I05]|nr:FecR domain-containing protein [Sulfurimonas sp. SAG-AH-194-I05]MDF1875064.1 FecR domain-containing protein [Sulfurimonas sp. SAG-AH-194-I05]
MYKYIILLLVPLLLQAEIGKILALKGEVNILRDTQTIKAFTGIDIEEKDIIKTGKAAQIQIMLKDKTAITIGRNSIFEIEEYLYDKTKKSKITMRVKKGIFYAISGKIGKINKNRFKLKTKSASISIRGTHFGGNIGETKETIGCFKGGIGVEAQGTTVDVGAGLMTSFTPGNIPNPPVTLNIAAMKIESKSKSKSSTSSSGDASKTKSESVSTKETSVNDNAPKQEASTPQAEAPSSVEPEVPSSLATDASGVNQENTVDTTVSVAQVVTSTPTIAPVVTTPIVIPNTPPTLSIINQTVDISTRTLSVPFTATDAESTTNTVVLATLFGSAIVNGTNIDYVANTNLNDFFGTDQILLRTTDSGGLITDTTLTLEVEHNLAKIGTGTHEVYRDTYVTFGVFSLNTIAAGNFLFNDNIVDTATVGYTTFSVAGINGISDFTPTATIDGYITANNIAKYSGILDGIVESGTQAQRVVTGIFDIEIDFNTLTHSGDFSYIAHDQEYTGNLSGIVANTGFTIDTLVNGEIRKLSDGSLVENLAKTSNTSGNFYGPSAEQVSGSIKIQGATSGDKSDLGFSADQISFK